MLMTHLSDTRDKIWNEETFIELEYLVTDFLATTEFSLLTVAFCVLVFLRLYWFGISLVGRIMGYDIG